MGRLAQLALATSMFVALDFVAARPAHADSFALNENSALELGRANSGAVVQDGDASAAYGNPALMSLFDQTTVTAAVSGLFGAGETFHDRGSTDLLGAPLGGSDEDFLEDSAIPAVHLIVPLAPRWRLGFSVSVPYGLGTDYGPAWAGRYQALTSELKTINVNPSLAYRINDEISVGLGVSMQYADASLSNAIDFGAVCFGALAPATCGALGLTPQQADGRVKVEGDDWSLGWNAGIAWAANDRLLFGLSYRSEVDHNLRGTADFDVPAAATLLTARGTFTDTSASAELHLPATIEAGVRWRASERATLYADARWREWSSLKELRVIFDNPAQPQSAEQLRYEDSWRFALGLDYALSEHWTLRGGYAYDETPTQDEFRSARISDDDRQYFTAGASWTGLEGWQVDLAYNRVEIADHDFDHTGQFGDRLMGKYEGAADVVSVGVTRRWGR